MHSTISAALMGGNYIRLLTENASEDIQTAFTIDTDIATIEESVKL